MAEDIIAVLGVVLIGMIWLVLHYVTKWRQAPKITHEDENLLDDMYQLARRLEDRVQTVERLVALDHPDYRAGIGESRPASPGYDLTRRN